MTRALHQIGVPFCLGAILLSLAACSRYRDDAASRAWPTRYPVQGTVTLDGRPIDGATVVFVANPDNDRSYTATGITDSTGHFRLQTFRPNDGAVTGRHDVQIVKLSVPEIPADLQAHEHLKPASESLLPGKYRSTKTSGLTAEVTKAGPNEFVFELSTK